MPHREQRPYVGFIPTMPQNAAGWRIAAAGVSPGGAEAKTGRNCRCRPSGRSPGHKLCVRATPPPRRHDRTEARRLVRRTHGKLVVVELAEQDRAVAPQIRGDRQLVCRNEITKDARTSRAILPRSALPPVQNAPTKTAPSTARSIPAASTSRGARAGGESDALRSGCVTMRLRPGELQRMQRVVNTGRDREIGEFHQ